MHSQLFSNKDLVRFPSIKTAKKTSYHVDLVPNILKLLKHNCKCKKFVFCWKAVCSWAVFGEMTTRTFRQTLFSSQQQTKTTLPIKENVVWRRPYQPKPTFELTESAWSVPSLSKSRGESNVRTGRQGQYLAAKSAKSVEKCIAIPGTKSSKNPKMTSTMKTTTSSKITSSFPKGTSSSNFRNSRNQSNLRRDSKSDANKVDRYTSDAKRLIDNSRIQMNRISSGGDERRTETTKGNFKEKFSQNKKESDLVSNKPKIAKDKLPGTRTDYLNLKSGPSPELKASSEEPSESIDKQLTALDRQRLLTYYRHLSRKSLSLRQNCYPKWLLNPDCD